MCQWNGNLLAARGSVTCCLKGHGDRTGGGSRDSGRLCQLLDRSRLWSGLCELLARSGLCELLDRSGLWNGLCELLDRSGLWSGLCDLLDRSGLCSGLCELLDRSGLCSGLCELLDQTRSGGRCRGAGTGGRCQGAGTGGHCRGAGTGGRSLLESAAAGSIPARDRRLSRYRMITSFQSRLPVSESSIGWWYVIPSRNSERRTSPLRELVRASGTNTL